MPSRVRTILLLALLVLPFLAAAGQEESSGPVININVSGNIEAVNYHARGATKIDFVGTPLLPRATGEAKVVSEGGSVGIDAEFKGLESPAKFGPGYAVYIVWALTPEGRANNLGQLIVKDGKSLIRVTTKLQTFAMMVTAEPYFAVAFPSEEVVLANKARHDTKGAVIEINTKLLERGHYKDAGLVTEPSKSKIPVDLLQARNAVQVAKWQQADKYAPEEFAKAQQALTQAEDYESHDQKKQAETVARNAVQAAEDARALAVRREQEEKLANERKAAADAQAAEAQRAADAQAAASQEAAARAQAQAQAEQEAQARAQAQAQAQQEAQARAAAEQQAQQQRDAAAQAEREKQELRARLLEQFNRVLPTTDTPRGLVVNMGDVLFDFGKADLRPAAREALARLSGIVATYPSLELTIEGHTDNIGTDEFNQTLSEKRAENVRDYLAAQGVDPSNMTSKGMGKLMPVADNSTPAGRQKNRRVEIIVSGEVIGTPIGVSPGDQQ
jgi:outer membrane protein OmpA-like peptidoglycan-associated protein